MRKLAALMVVLDASHAMTWYDTPRPGRRGAMGTVGRRGALGGALAAGGTRWRRPPASARLTAAGRAHGERRRNLCGGARRRLAKRPRRDVAPVGRARELAETSAVLAAQTALDGTAAATTTVRLSAHRAAGRHVLRRAKGEEDPEPRGSATSTWSFTGKLLPQLSLLSWPSRLVILPARTLRPTGCHPGRA